jgi:hypothetical protein
MSNNQPKPIRVNHTEEIMATSTDIDDVKTVFHDDVEIEQQRRCSEKFLTHVKKAEEDAHKRQNELSKKFVELRKRKADEKLQCARRNDLDLLIGSLQADIDAGRLTETMAVSTFISCDYDCNIAHMLLIEMLEIERQAEHQAVIDNFYGMREGLGRYDMTREECQELLEANDWDLTKTIVSLSGT